MQNFNKKVQEWFNSVKKFSENDTMEKALQEGRVGVRTFLKSHLFTDLQTDKKSTYGEQGLKIIGEKLKNPSLYPQSLSFSILPTRPFGAKHGDRYGFLATLPNQEDIMLYKKYTNKEFIKQHNIDPNLVKTIKEYLTRVSYFDSEDLYSEVSGKHYRPNFDEANKDKIQKQAYSYQDYADDKNIHDLNYYNEALIKLRQSSKICIVAFNENDLKDLLDKNAKDVLPNNNETEYALFDADKNLVKFANQEKYNQTKTLEFEKKIDYTKVTKNTPIAETQTSSLNLEAIKDDNISGNSFLAIQNNGKKAKANDDRGQTNTLHNTQNNGKKVLKNKGSSLLRK